MGLDWADLALIGHHSSHHLALLFVLLEVSQLSLEKVEEDFGQFVLRGRRELPEVVVHTQGPRHCAKHG